MSYDFKITIQKASIAFVVGGIAALIPFLKGLTDPQVVIYIPILVSMLIALQNYLKHRGD